MIELRTLGALELTSADSRTVGSVLAQPRRAALLCYLALALPRGFHRRDTLFALFWPEYDAEQARHALRQSVYVLRRALGATSIVSRGDEELALASDQVCCDVWAFDAAVEQGRAADALALYRGELLAGFHISDAPDFERWLDEERSRLRQRAGEAAWALAAARERDGDAAGAAEAARRAAALSPTDETALRRLLLLLERLGDRMGAVRDYEAFAWKLEREYELQPSAEMQAVVARIRAESGVSQAAPPAHRREVPSPSGNGNSNVVREGGSLKGPGERHPQTQPLERCDRETQPLERYDRVEFAAAVRAAAERAPLVGPVPGPHRRSVRNRIVVAATVALVVIAVAFSVNRRFEQAPETLLDPNLLAVAPFDVLDPSLQLWREGLVDVLSRDLDGAGPLRTVSQTVTLNRWAGRADRTSAAALGRRTGAGLVVFGSVLRKGADSVSLRASVLDRARSETEPDLEIVGEERRMGELADSLGVSILRALGRGRPIGAVRHVSIASRSLPALKAFLRGEQFYRRGLWDSALVHYDQAIAQDSAFALSLRRMNAVLSWFPVTAGTYRDLDEYRRRAVTLNHGLSPRDSLMITADSLDIAADDALDPIELVDFRFRAAAAREEAARRYPNDPEIWYELGEFRVHEPPLGNAPALALQAFERAIALDSGFTPAYEHAVRLAIQLGQPNLARRYARTYAAFDPTDINAPSLRLVALVLDSGGLGSAPVTRAIQTASAEPLWRAGFDHLSWWPDSAETAVALLRELATGRHQAEGGAPWVADSLKRLQYLATALAFRGHLHAAAETNRRLVAHPEDSPWTSFPDPFLELALLGAIADSASRRAFAQAWEPRADWGGMVTPWGRLVTPRHLRGLPWWFSRGDTAALARFEQRAATLARSARSPIAMLRARYLAHAATAYLTLARADSAAALRLFQAIPDTLCIAADCFFEKLTLARLLAARGEDRGAAELLDRWQWVEGNTPSAVLATLERGRIAERLGESGKAVACYRFVADVWRRADPELQTYVTEAREGFRRQIVELRR